MHFGEGELKKAAQPRLPAAPVVSSPPTRRRRFGIHAARKSDWRGFSSDHIGRSIGAAPSKFVHGKGMVAIDGLGYLGIDPLEAAIEEAESQSNYPATTTYPSTTGASGGTSVLDFLKSGVSLVKQATAGYFDYKVQKTAADVASAQLRAGQIPTVGVTPTGVNPGSPYYPYGAIQRTASAVPVWVYAAGGALLLVVLLKRR